MAFNFNGIAVEIPERLQSYYSSESPALGVLPQMSGEGLGGPFVQFVVSNWKEIALSFDSFAKTEAQRELVVIAAEFLPPEAYVQFLGSLGDKTAEGKIPFETIQCIAFARMKKEGFLAFNYDQPAVRKLVERFKVLTPPADSEMRRLFDRIESGDAKAELVSLREANGEPLPEKLAGAAIQPEKRDSSAQGPSPNATPSSQSPTAKSNVVESAKTNETGESIKWPYALVGILLGGAIILFAWRRRRHG